MKLLLNIKYYICPKHYFHWTGKARGLITFNSSLESHKLSTIDFDFNMIIMKHITLRNCSIKDMMHQILFISLKP